MEFLTNKQIELNAANYLISSNTKKPVNHIAFVAAQNQADYICRLADAIKGKTFKAGKLDDLCAIKAAVRAAMNDTKQSYGTAPTKPTGELTSKLADEAMAFVEFDKTKSKFEQINNVMQQFNSISDIENVGDYFEEKVVKVARIYTISEIQAAVELTVDILG